MRVSVAKLLILVAALLLSQTAAADVATTGGILNDVTKEFIKASSDWAATIKLYATWLFWTLATISMVWTFGFMAMRKADIGEFFAEFIRFIIFTGFYLWLLRNGADFAMDIIRSLMKIGAKAGGVAELTPSTPITIGFQIIAKASKSISIFKPGDSLAIVLVSLIILLCLATVAANVLMVLVTAWIMAYAGMFVLGFGGSRWTSDIAIGYFRAIAGIAMKLLAMTLMIGIATSVMKNLLNKIDGGASIEQLLVPCVVSFVLAMLIHTLPNIIAGLIPGGGGAAGATGSFSAGTMASAGMQTVKTASSVAGAAFSGGASMMGSMASMAGGMASGVASGAQSMYSAFRGMQSGASGGAGMASQIAGMLGGGGGSSGGGASPLGGAMGLASAASSGMGGGSAASALSSMESGGGQESGSSSGGAAGANEGSAEGGSGSSSGEASGGAASGSGSSASGGAEGSSGSSNSGASNGGSTRLAQAASGTQGAASNAVAGSGQAKGGSSGSAMGASANNMASASRTAQASASSMTSGSGQMAQSPGQTPTGKLTAQSPTAGTGSNGSSLDTRSASRSFDPSTEVADFRDSKQERT